MSATLDFQHESLSYTATYASPPFELWGGLTGGVVKQLYSALAPYSVGMKQIQISPAMQTAGDTVVTVRVGNTTLKFSYEQLEVTFGSFTEAEFQAIPKFLTSATAWIPKVSKDFRFSTHKVGYHSHSLLKGITVDDFLRNLTRSHASFGGLNIGGGIILHRIVPDKKWRVELIVDKSKPIPGALYMGLTLDIEANELNYDSLLTDGRTYFVDILRYFELELPSNP
jgi:hypothetical protein